MYRYRCGPFGRTTQRRKLPEPVEKQQQQQRMWKSDGGVGTMVGNRRVGKRGLDLVAKLQLGNRPSRTCVPKPELGHELSCAPKMELAHELRGRVVSQGVGTTEVRCGELPSLRRFVVHPEYAYPTTQRKYRCLFSVGGFVTEHSRFRRFNPYGNREEAPVLPCPRYQVRKSAMNPICFPFASRK